MTNAIYLKVDVDTYLGMKKGVPILMDLFRDFQIKATFFLSFGPDRSGRAVFNIWRKKGFLKKMLRTNAPALYGFRTMLYGTLLPSPKIASRFPDWVRRIEDEGHEVGVHAWNHRLWQDHLDHLPPRRIRRELEKAFEAYESILGHPPRSTAAPAWYCNEVSLSVQDSLNLDFCSDTRGEGPFFPILNGREFKTMQIPTTMACLEEIIAVKGGLRLSDYLNIERREVESNVFPLHAEVEGNIHCSLFRSRLAEMRDDGIEFLPLRELHKIIRGPDIPRCRVIHKNIPGRAGTVAVQDAWKIARDAK